VAIPLGSLVQGALAAVIGAPTTLAVASALLLAVVGVLAASGRLQSLDADTQMSSGS
jgi:hypothetical protein